MKTLDEWLTWINKQHPVAMDLGLDRIKKVANHLGITSFSIPVITVTGTNGKGSCVALLQAILSEAGYQVGAYTSPHLLRFNERICINGHAIDDKQLINLFSCVDKASQQTCSLTYFEYTTLVALLHFQQSNLDVILLEVGLGGRLDAVNIIDADVSVITSIALDHMQWLGNNREAIAKEKSGIMRPHKPIICGDEDMPNTIYQQATALSAPLYCQGNEFSYSVSENSWNWQSTLASYTNLPLPQLALQNASTVLMALTCLREQLPVSITNIHHGLQRAFLPGRCQCIPGNVDHYIDVAHNSAASTQLAARLQYQSVSGKTYAVVGMLADKAITNILLPLQPYIDEWYVSQINTTPRGASGNMIRQKLAEIGITNVHATDTLATAYQQARARTLTSDRIVIMGSFHTVAAVWPIIQTAEAVCD